VHADPVRRSSAVKLTLLPMLASAAVAAQPATPDEPPLAPPGATEPMLSPPGLTPTLDDCRLDPGAPRCAGPLTESAQDPEETADDERKTYHGGGSWVFHGFGHYFWHAGG
jgi:hypothetical protein